MLEPRGLRIIEAADGRRALELARTTDLHVAIVDLIMPEMDGLETIRELRRLRPEIGIIAISGALRGQLELATLLGSDAVLAKPLRDAELVKVVRRVIAERGKTPRAPES
jgi:CheY-like chemotaxis protein